MRWGVLIPVLFAGQCVVSHSKVRTVSAWLAQVVLALGFAAAALGKLAGNPHWIERFRGYGYSPRFLVLIGVLEAAGAVGLLIAPVAGYAAIGLFAIMTGATCTHLANREASQLWRPLLFMALLSVVIYIRRPWPLKQRTP